MAKVRTQYVCQNCGYNSPRYLGRCPNCGEWNSLVEEQVEANSAPTKKATTTLTGLVAKPQKINEIDSTETPRVKTKLNELNRVLGEGNRSRITNSNWWGSGNREIYPPFTSFWTIER